MLGVGKMLYLSTGDLDDISGYKQGGIYFVVCTSNVAHRPETGDGYVVVFRWVQGNYTTQIFVNPNTDSIWIRSNRSSSNVEFEPWKQIQII